MKKLSLKAKITLWYGVFLVFIVGLLMLLLLWIGSAQIEEALTILLRNSVYDAADEIEFENGVLDVYDDDIHYYRDNVYLSVYDDQGQQLAGFTPGAFTLPQTRQGEPYTVRQQGEHWLVCDRLAQVPQFGSIWMRGCVSLTLALSELHSILLILLILTPLFLLAALVGGYLIIRRGFVPIGKVMETARSIRGGKDLSRRINLKKGGIEIVELANTFDEMFDTLQSSFEAEKQFTSDASHELRTPVAAILAQSENAIEHSEDSEQALKGIHDEAVRMSALISQLLLLARADNNALVLQKERINLSELVELTCQSLQNDKVELCWDLEPNVELLADETMMMRLYVNLIENAINYTPQGGRVTISLKREDDRIISTVSDTGIGIKKEHQEDIFRRFFRVDASRTATGAGLGLPMVRFIAEQHGGSVRVKSEPGQGACFIVEFDATF